MNLFFFAMNSEKVKNNNTYSFFRFLGESFKYPFLKDFESGWAFQDFQILANSANSNGQLQNNKMSYVLWLKQHIFISISQRITCNS